MSAIQRPDGPAGPRTGDVLDDRYRLDEILGTGGTADVFRAADLRLRREVAVKVFRPGATAVSADRFCEEAILLGRLSHPALLAVHDTGRYLGGAYVVMHLVNGITLRERIHGGAPLTDADVARLGEQLALALAHAHAAGIVHRDVKPSNVLLGPGDIPYLADFGISRLIDDPTRAEPGTVVGTVPYLAPEQVLGRGAGPASDIYSLGLVLLEAVKGEKEYQGAPLEASAARLLRSPEIPRWLQAELAHVIEAMTRSEPRERPDARRCAELLHRAAASRSPRALAAMDVPTRPSRTVVHGALAHPERRRRALVAGLTAVVVVGATAATLLAMDGGPATPDTGSHRSAPASATASPSTPTGEVSPARVGPSTAGPPSARSRHRIAPNRSLPAAHPASPAPALRPAPHGRQDPPGKKKPPAPAPRKAAPPHPAGEEKSVAAPKAASGAGPGNEAEPGRP
ncbi:serine/threonine-protein kinase [Streptomyces sp. IBSBF 2435]|uniref:serine/threonine-protein kinase n=1 Tax=Streptomyces sp. IBSBF 2435 TaxID=2903531 RepID=UPI002FDC2B83